MGPGAVIELDVDGVVTDWDADAERLFGWSRLEAIGMPSGHLVPSRNRARHSESMRAAASQPGQNSQTRRITALHRDGHEFTIELTTTANLLSGVCRIVTIAREIDLADQ